MPEGYPDYERLGRSGQYQLYFGAPVTPAENTVMFQGYVGNFPFVNVFTNMAASVDFMQLIFAWYSDSTFTQQVAFRVALRTGGSFAVTQYANLSDWLQVFYVSKSGGTMTFGAISIYGTQQPSDSRKLSSQDTAMYSFNGNINASSTLDTILQKIIPGNSLFNLFAGATSWFVNFLYYDWGTNAWQQYYAVTHNSFTDSSCHIEVPVLDCPLRIQVANQDAAARQFSLIWNTCE